MNGGGKRAKVHFIPVVSWSQFFFLDHMATAADELEKYYLIVLYAYLLSQTMG